MIKKLSYISFLLIVFLLSASIAQAESLELDLEKAVDMALENNLELQEEKINLEKAELEYEKSMADNLSSQSEYNELNAKSSLKNAQNSYQNTLDSVIKSVIQEYNNLWLSENNLKTQEKKVELEEKLLEESEKKFEIGDIGNVSLLEQKNTFDDSKYNLKTAKDDYEQSLREFKTTLGISSSKSLELNDLDNIEIWETSEDEVVEKTLKNSMELELEEINLELSKLDSKRSEVSSSEVDKKIAQKDVKAAELSQKRSKEDLENSSILAFHDYQHSIEEMDLKKNSYEKAKEDYKLKKEQSEKGMLKKSELLNYEISKIQSEHDYYSSLTNYYNKRIELKQQMNLELEVVNSDY